MYIHKFTELSIYFTEIFYKCIKHRIIDECSTVPYTILKQFLFNCGKIHHLINKDKCRMILKK